MMDDIETIYLTLSLDIPESRLHVNNDEKMQEVWRQNTNYPDVSVYVLDKTHKFRKVRKPYHRDWF